MNRGWRSVNMASKIAGPRAAGGRHEHPRQEPVSRGPRALAGRSRGFLGRGRARDRLDRAGEEDLRSLRRRLRPLVHRRRGQHLLQRARPPCRGRTRQPGGADPRLPAQQQHGHQIHLCRAAERGADARRRHAGFRRRQGRPRHPLYADGGGSRGGDARLRAHRRGAQRGVRRLRGEGTGDPHRRCQAETGVLGELRARARPHRAIQAAARRGDQARERQTVGLHHPAAAAARLRSHRRPRP